MPQRTAASPGAAEQHPADIETMRDTARRALDLEDVLPADDMLTLTEQLRGHLRLMVPEVEAMAARQGKESIPRACALACVGEARMKLTLQSGPGMSREAALARRLARVLNALCDHYQNLGSAHGCR
ncbi:DUF6415 family natural product biosynthesis protein [Streptomyces sp. NPDC002265]|uniref:DUF6415 family natural product biosynthesis protein n=1 Tax=Streptomyces sp. NPDC002265 TaxID=3154415 RepID=UPI00331C2CD6